MKFAFQVLAVLCMFTVVGVATGWIAPPDPNRSMLVGILFIAAMVSMIYAREMK